MLKFLSSLGKCYRLQILSTLFSKGNVHCHWFHPFLLVTLGHWPWPWVKSIMSNEEGSSQISLMFNWFSALNAAWKYIQNKKCVILRFSVFSCTENEPPFKLLRVICKRSLFDPGQDNCHKWMKSMCTSFGEECIHLCILRWGPFVLLAICRPAYKNTVLPSRLRSSCVFSRLIYINTGRDNKILYLLYCSFWFGMLRIFAPKAQVRIVNLWKKEIMLKVNRAKILSLTCHKKGTEFCYEAQC